VNRLAAHDERLPLYQRLRDDLLQRLAAGEWPPGAAIPTEAELTQTYGLATGTVRKAIDKLVADGVLTRSQGKGTYVKRPSFDSSLFRFFRFKTKGGAAVRPTARVHSRHVRVPPAGVRKALGLAENVDDSDSAGAGASVCVVLSRTRQVDEQVVLVEEIWLPRGPFEPLVTLKLEDFGDLLYPLYEQTCRQRVATAREKLTVETASRALAARLGIPVGSAVIAVQRTAFNFAGQAIEWRCTRGSAAGFQYEVDIR
jgi:GntR family transcriptional regulator